MKVGSSVKWAPPTGANAWLVEEQMQLRIDDHGKGPFTITAIDNFLGTGSRLIQFIDGYGHPAIINESWLKEL